MSYWGVIDELLVHHEATVWMNLYRIMLIKKTVSKVYTLCDYTCITMIANLVCQLDQATGCPDFGSGIVLDVSVRVFLNEMDIRIGSSGVGGSAGWGSDS